MVHTSFMKIKLDKISQHPENERIYSPSDLEDLESSLNAYGQQEPIAITKQYKIISGHRRYMSMKNLGWEECEVRIIQPDNEIISLIEFNRHRTKTNNDILNEARYLEKELKNNIGRGRNASQERTGKKKGQRITMVMELSQKLGIGTTKLKQLLSISNYEPDLIKKIDKGELSVSKAYEMVRTKHINSNNKISNKEEYRNKFKKFIKDSPLSFKEITQTIKETYPYSKEMTGIDDERRQQLIEHLERLRKMDSREILVSMKQDELENNEISSKEIKEARKLLPSIEEVGEFIREDYPIIYCTNNNKVRDGTGKVLYEKFPELTKRLWTVLRIGVHSQEHSEGPGRGMSWFIGFKIKKSFKLLGLVSFHSDSRVLKVRDEHIGWTDSQNSANREHIVNMNVCVPTQPFGYNYLGGKFMSITAPLLIKDWEEKYKTKIVGITTTSLFGSKSQYSSMKWWKHLGTTSGQTIINPLQEEYQYWREWLKTNYPENYEKSANASSPKQKILNEIMRFLGIRVSQYYHNHKRGVFFCPLYENYREFLCNKIPLDKLKPVQMDSYVDNKKIDLDSSGWWQVRRYWWRKKSTDRFDKLKKDNQLQLGKVFLDNINDKDLERWLKSRGI